MLSHGTTSAPETNLSKLPRVAALCQCGYFGKPGRIPFINPALSTLTLSGLAIQRPNSDYCFAAVPGSETSTRAHSPALHFFAENTRASAGCYSISKRAFMRLSWSHGIRAVKRNPEHLRGISSFSYPSGKSSFPNPASQVLPWRRFWRLKLR